ncbi:MAG: hypothetical protein II029_06560, partial [Bacteroidales bacterium]|nr:hypothetical protein [Bacteroidales bacterium]
MEKLPDACHSIQMPCAPSHGKKQREWKGQGKALVQAWHGQKPFFEKKFAEKEKFPTFATQRGNSS